MSKVRASVVAGLVVMTMLAAGPGFGAEGGEGSEVRPSAATPEDPGRLAAPPPGSTLLPQTAAAPTAAVDAGLMARPKGKKKGRLKVNITGLIAGNLRPQGILRGPGVRKVVRKATFSVKGRPGRYTLVLKPVKSRTTLGTLHKGAVAYPAAKKFRARVKKGRTTLLTAGYGAVVARGAVTAPARPRSIQGDPGNPSAIVVKRSKRYVVGGYVTSGPTKAYPKGLLSRITGISKAKRTMRLGLAPADATDVVPELAAGPATATIGSGQAMGRPKIVKIPRGPRHDVGKFIPCTTTTGGAQPFSLEIGMEMQVSSIAWSSLAESFFVSEILLKPHVTADNLIPAGASLSCTFPQVGETFPFGIAIGPVVIPMFYGAGFQTGFTIGNEGTAPFGFDASADLGFGVDTRLPDGEQFYGVSRWTGTGVTPGSIPSVAGVASATFVLGVGIDGLASIRGEWGPELSANFYADRCDVAVYLTASLNAQFLIFDEELTSKKSRIIGPLPACTGLDPIVGSWGSNQYDYGMQIQQLGANRFKSTALKDFAVSSGCVAIPAGSSDEFTGGQGAYTWTSTLYDSDDCALLASDPQAKVTIDPSAPSSFRSCADFGKYGKRCQTYTRGE